MKQLKRFSALIFALVIWMSVLPLTVFAADTVITVASVSAKPGDTIEIPITITEVKKAVAISMHVQYDGDVLEVVSATMSDTVKSMNLANANTEPINNPNEVWLAAVSGSEKTIKGEVMTITFVVKDDAPAGKSAITIDTKAGLSVVINPNYQQVSLHCENGTVNVEGDETEDTTTAEKTTTTKKPTKTTVADDKTTTAKKTTTTVKKTTTTKKSTTKKTTTTEAPTTATTVETTEVVTAAPTEPTAAPSKQPSRAPSKIPSKPPTEAPIEDITDAPTEAPTEPSESVDTTTATEKETTTTKKATKTTDSQKTTTTKKSASTTVLSTTAVTVTTPKGESIEITEDTAVDIQGAVVTAPNGKPSLVQTVAVMIDSVTVSPEQVVTMAVSLSDVKALTTMGISLSYDPSVMTFTSGECRGFLQSVQDKVTIAENERGIVDISMIGTEAVGGSGEIALLRFTVQKNVKNGEYRVSAAGNPLIQNDQVELPVKVVAGIVTVEGGLDADLHSIPSYMVLPAVIAVALITLIVALVMRRKKGAKPSTPGVIDVSGDDEE